MTIDAKRLEEIREWAEYMRPEIEARKRKRPLITCDQILGFERVDFLLSHIETLQQEREHFEKCYIATNDSITSAQAQVASLERVMEAANEVEKRWREVVPHLRFDGAMKRLVAESARHERDWPKEKTDD